MTTPLLLRAAEMLEALAADIEASNTTSDGVWPDEDEHDRRAHADHDEALEVAKGLRHHLTPALSPTGGEGEEHPA